MLRSSAFFVVRGLTHLLDHESTEQGHIDDKKTKKRSCLDFTSSSAALKKTLKDLMLIQYYYFSLASSYIA